MRNIKDDKRGSMLTASHRSYPDLIDERDVYMYV